MRIEPGGLHVTARDCDAVHLRGCILGPRGSFIRHAQQQVRARIALEARGTYLRVCCQPSNPFELEACQAATTDILINQLD